MHESDHTLDYKNSGVDVRAGEEAVSAIKALVRQTYNTSVLSDLGSFGGLYRLDRPELREAVLVASTDGVGTKLRVAIMANRFDTIGQDLVNHCVNDILVQGAEPLFFLDYIGLGRLEPVTVRQLVEGMVAACKANDCALIGGEMAEMPGIYQSGDFDLVGTIVGVAERSLLLTPERVQAGDILLGLPSSGLHTNGYSLARKIVFDRLGLQVQDYVPELGCTLADALLTVHTSYLSALRPWLRDPRLHALAHITGGGIAGNLKRVIPDGLSARVDYPLSRIPPLFAWLRQAGGLGDDTLREAFNLGVGMIAVLEPTLRDGFCADTGAFDLGEVIPAQLDAAKVVFND